MLLAAVAALGSVGAQAQGTQDPIKIGILTDFSGVFTDYTGVGTVLVTEFAVQDFGGKVLGRPIEIVRADHQNKTDVGLAITRKWLSEEGVDVVVGASNSAITLGIMSLIRDRDRVLLTDATSSDLTGKACTPNSVQFGMDSYSEASVAAGEVVKRGGKSWYFLTADYALGHAIAADAIAVVKSNGGTVLGEVRTPFNTQDFSSFLLNAQASNAQVIGFAEAGKDLTNSLKQAAEFGLKDGQIFVAPHLETLDVRSVGLDVMQGTYFTESWYWDQNDEARAFAKRFQEKRGFPPLRGLAATYSMVLHYLKAVEATGSEASGKAVVAKMRELPVNDLYARDGRVREDGRLLKEMYIAQVKSPGEAKGEWDIYKILSTVPGAQAFRPAAESACPLVQASR
jgi:branched-chain amino acid transport system substrate-binding protein